jgi:hypothetical protein
MIKQLFFLVSLFYAVVTLSQTDNDSILEWQSRKLIEKDFKSDFDQLRANAIDEVYKEYGLGYLTDTTFFGLGTYSNIRIAIQPEEINVYNFKDLEFKAIFQKYFSAIKNREDIPHTLLHEQIHFDIAEIYVRKIKLEHKKAVTQFYKVYTLAEKDKIIDGFLDYFDEMVEENMKTQMHFDRSVIGGNDREREERWRKKLDKALSNEADLIKFNGKLSG